MPGFYICRCRPLIYFLLISRPGLQYVVIIHSYDYTYTRKYESDYLLIYQNIHFQLILFIHTTTATIDLQGLKQTAATKLQTLQTQATESFQQFVDTIDLDKVKQLDVLNILPKLQYKGQIIQDTVMSLPEYKKRVRFYLQQIKSLTGKDLVLAFDAGVPWPVKRMDDEKYAIDF